MKCIPMFFWSCSAIVLAMFVVHVADAQTPDRVQMDEIIKQWEARQQRAKTVRVEWTEEFTEFKGSLSKVLPELSRDGVFPQSDATFKNKGTLIIDGDRIHSRYACHVWCMPKKQYVEDDATHVFDGSVVRNLTTGGTVDYPFGLITDDKLPNEVTMPRLRPLLMNFRPTSQTLSSFRGRPLSLTNRQALVQNRICVEAQVRWPGPTTYRLWLDPTRGYIITRIVAVEKDVIIEKADLEYVQNDQYGWLLDGWEYSRYLSDQTLHRFIRAKINLLDINATVSEETFQISWPVGTFVVDERTSDQFIQKENGKVRKVSTKEWTNQTYEQLSRTPESASRWERLLDWRILLAAFLLAVTGFFLVRYRSRRNLRNLVQ